MSGPPEWSELPLRVRLALRLTRSRWGRLLMKPFISKYLGSLVRHGLTVFAGWLAAKGIADLDLDRINSATDMIVEIGTPLALWGVAQVWSLIDKKGKS